MSAASDFMSELTESDKIRSFAPHNSAAVPEREGGPLAVEGSCTLHSAFPTLSIFQRLSLKGELAAVRLTEGSFNFPFAKHSAFCI